jgi:hypothetical protein
MQALKSDVRSASQQVNFNNQSGDLVSPERGAAFSDSRGLNASLNLESLNSNSSEPSEVHFDARGKADCQSVSVSEVEESFGFIDALHSNMPFQMRTRTLELPSKFVHINRPPCLVTPASLKPILGDVSGGEMLKTQDMKSSANVVHDVGDISRLQSVQLHHLHQVECQSRKPRVVLDDMLKELQNVMHQLKVLHAFPPGSNFEDEHSELVKAIVAMTTQLAELKYAMPLDDTNNVQSSSRSISANDLHELVSEMFIAETLIPSRQSIHGLSHLESSLIFCNRNNLSCSIRECLTKARSDWSAQYRRLEEQYLKSCQEIKTTRHEAADAIQKATAQYKDAEVVWETNHSHHMITIGNLREQLHNITVRYSNLQLESKSEQESQGKEFRQQIFHLQGQVSALKQVAEHQTFHNAEETRRYEALSLEHDKLLQTMSMLHLKNEDNDALCAENSKIQLILQQQQADYDSLASKYSSLQSHCSQQQSSFQQLVSSSSSSSKEVTTELRSQISELLADQKRNHDALTASLRTNSALENENDKLQQLLNEKSLEIHAKDDEIRQHELLQLACAESESNKLQECTSILLEARNSFQRMFPGFLQECHNGESSKLHHVDICDLIRSDMAIISDRQLTLEKLIPELRNRIKILRTQAKVASSKAQKDTEDCMYEVENIMDHTVDTHLRQQILAAVDGAKSQLRDLNVAQEHHFVMGIEEIKEQLRLNIIGTTIRDRSLQAKVFAIFELKKKTSGRHINR